MAYGNHTLASFGDIFLFLVCDPRWFVTEASRDERAIGRIGRSGKSRVREPMIELHPPARRDWPSDRMQPN
jgi:hypothetical protein